MYKQQLSYTHNIYKQTVTLTYLEDKWKMCA